ncbi:hypothetical protein [Paenibacillus sp. DMB5]|uniref:hypothetical protein n=1 Tax=Paenibacillus sp. DMB5 TaxID=1780103 RepID=UPI00076C212A|nr:hypothetical protein [Paenibacillus sp. DMB5]KUP22375.1 hypothetical protein AWJ19_27540 [Paenibacillus sp. DMB5]
MTESAREPTMAGLLNQYEAIGGPEEYGPEGIAIMVALWRKSSKLGWRQAFQMTNTELTLQTGIKSRDTLNTHRSKLVKAGLIGYTPPPRGSSKGDYQVRFDLIVVGEVVRKSDNFSELTEKVVQNPDHFNQVVGEPVRKLDHFPDTVLKDLSTTITTTASSEWIEPKIDPEADGMIAILNAYCELNSKLDFHVKQREREAMGKMVAGGMPVPFTITTMAGLLQAKREREGNNFKYPTSFLYYVDGIEEAWLNSQTTSPPMDGVAPGDKQDPHQPKKTKQQQEIDDLDRWIREEEAREQAGSR